MHSFRRLAFLLALAFPVMPVLLAQTPGSSSSNPTDPPASQAQGSQPGQAQQPAQQTLSPMTVEQRLRLRREQRRAAAIHNTYDHGYEAYMTLGYLRFTPGPSRQRLTDYGWDTGLTRYFTRRLGVNFDARGYDGIAYVGPNPTNIMRYKVSQYDLMIGPTYRFYIQPRYSISARIMGGWALGNFTGDTGSFGSLCNLGSGFSGCLLYPDGSTYAASASLLGDYNFTPTVSLRVAPEYFFTGFGSTTQSSRGFTIGLAYRFGKQ